MWGIRACCCGKKPPVPPADCNDCDPPLFGEYTITISGLAEGLSQYNGTYTVTYRGNCLWDLKLTTPEGGLIWVLSLVWDSEFEWLVEMTDLLSFYIIYFPPNQDPCEPLGTYDFEVDWCWNPFGFPDACAESSASTAVVA